MIRRDKIAISVFPPHIPHFSTNNFFFTFTAIPGRSKKKISPSLQTSSTSRNTIAGKRTCGVASVVGNTGIYHALPYLVARGWQGCDPTHVSVKELLHRSSPSRTL
jgi:hypothetical protein